MQVKRTNLSFPVPKSLPTAWLAMILILIVAGGLRFHGINWDSGYYAHPDESFIDSRVGSGVLHWPSNILDLFNADTSTMNPRRIDPSTGQYMNYSYGTLLLYLLMAVSAVVSKFLGPQYASMQDIYLVGRAISALADTITVLGIFLLGRMLFSARVGLLASVFATLSVLQVQYGHFYVAEPLMTMFLTLALFEVLRTLRTRRYKDAILAGLLMGFAVGTKPSAAAFTVAGVLILLLGSVITGRGTGSWLRLSFLRGLLPGVRFALVSGIAALAAWAVSEPYAVMDIRTYFANIQAESMIQRGITDVPYTLQYVGTVPGWYQLSQYVRFGVGLPLGIVVVFGLIWALARLIRWTDWRCAVLLLWIAPYTFSILTLQAKWLRYMIPIAPMLLIFAAALLWHWHDRLHMTTYRSWVNRWVRPNLAAMAMVAVVAGSALWTITYQTIYTKPHTWVQASRWIYAHVPSGSTIGFEAWDQQLPLGLPGQNPQRYQGYRFDSYQDQSPRDKLGQTETTLASSDYIVLPTNRLVKGMSPLPWRFPVGIRFYDLLFQNRLGFRKVAEFNGSPSLFGARVNEQGADDNVAVYDHPTVMIFKKVRPLQSWEYEALFSSAADSPWSFARSGSTSKSLLLAPFRDLTATGLPFFSGTWRSGPVASVVWFLVLELLGASFWLLARPLFARLPERGWAISKVLGLALVTWLAWIVAAIGLLPSTQLVVWLALGAVLLTGAALSLAGWRYVIADVRAAWRTILAFDVVFLLLFVGGVLLRLANPDLWQPVFGGEKPMELAFINGILRSSQIPPYDPWFAGGYINYYYYGQWMAAELMRLASVAPNYGFNLADATMLALTGTTASAIGYTVARRLSRRAAIVVAVLSVLFTIVIGNLDGAVQAVQFAVGGRLGSLWSGFDFWRSTRLPQGAAFIHEFPYFTFLYGDLHAHMIAMPLGLSLVLLAAYLTIERDRLGTGRVVGIAAAGGLLIGLLAMTNPWDVFAYGGLFALGLLLHMAVASRRWWLGLPGFVPMIALTTAVAVCSYLPSFLAFKSFYSQVGLVHTATPLWIFLDQLGLFVFIALWQAARSTLPTRIGQIVLALCALGFIAGLILGHAVLGVSAALCLLMLFSALVSIRRPAVMVWSGLVAAGFLIWAGIEVFYLKDFLDNSPYYRQNTVFKFGLESWLLLAVGSAGLLYTLFASLLRGRGGGLQPADDPSARKPEPALARVGRILPAAASVSLILGSLIYTVLGGHTRLIQRFPVTPPVTLDGYAYMKTATLPNESGTIQRFVYDYQAIQWLNSNIRKPRTIAEASVGPYRGNGSRVSEYTGLPAVLGWNVHESQQRYPDEVSRRDSEIRTLYDTSDIQQALEVIERYGIQYIYVGTVERHYELPGDQSAGISPEPYASKQGLEKFDKMTGKFLTVIYRNPDVTIYRVNPTWQWRVDSLNGF